MTDLVITILIVTGAAAWAAFLCVAVWALVVEGIQWHREGRARLARSRYSAEALEQAHVDIWEQEMSR